MLVEEELSMIWKEEIEVFMAEKISIEWDHLGTLAACVRSKSP